MEAVVSKRARVGLLLVMSLWSAASNIAVASVGYRNFLLPDGDNVTCIPIEAQVSLGGNKTYNRYPTTVITLGNSSSDTHGVRLAQQTIALVADGCVNGTIPVRGVVQGGSARVRSSKRMPGQALYWNNSSAPHEYGSGELDYSKAPGAYKGTEVFLNIWKPQVESISHEFSLGQLSLTAGPNTVEAGNQVLPGNYGAVGGDDLPRLFVSWTADLYNATGCYDLDCPGFVQVSNTVLAGGSFANISTRSGQQYEIKLRVFKDDGTGDWWLQLNDEYVGYWPTSIYTNYSFAFAERVIWYGEIIDDEPADGNVHTTTQMGSGHFANEGYGKAAYMRNLQYINQNNALVDAPFIVSDTNSSCYSVEKGTNFSSWASYYYYGGPGRSADCVHNPAYTNP